MVFFKLTDSITERQLAEAIESLPSWRKEKATSFAHIAGKIACTYSYLLVMEALKKVYSITDDTPWQYNEYGKPFLTKHKDIHFNISHCKGAVACIVGNQPVGIDIESIRPLKEDLLRYCCNKGEINRIYSSPNPEQEFARLWTCKEAIFKLLGTGITHSVKSILTENPLLRPCTSVIRPSGKDSLLYISYITHNE